MDNEYNLEQFADEIIGACVGFVSAKDAKCIKNELRCHKHNCEKHKVKGNDKAAQECDKEYWHTIGELVAGAFVASQGFRSEFRKQIGRQRPDWFVEQGPSGRGFILEVFNLELDMAASNELTTRGSALRWRVDSAKINETRLWSSLTEKAGKYKNLIIEHDLGFVIAGHACCEIDLRRADIANALNGTEGFLENHREVNGVLIFGPIGKRYYFTYSPNPFSEGGSILLTDGMIPMQ